MKKFTVTPIGIIRTDSEGMRIELDKKYIKGLTNIQEYGHINVLWWFSECDNEESRSKLITNTPYKGAPEVIGTFATRSPERPNPIALTCCGITYIDMENGIIGLTYIEAHDGTPVLDIKPYAPSLDRVEKPKVPSWCKNWPDSLEKSGDFDWGSVFNF